MRTLWAIMLAFPAFMAWGEPLQAVEPKKDVPVVEVETPIYHFEQVTQGEVVKHDFKVLNHGSAPLEINSVKPG
jgi:hypothetical protein